MCGTEIEKTEEDSRIKKIIKSRWFERGVIVTIVAVGGVIVIRFFKNEIERLTVERDDAIVYAADQALEADFWRAEALPELYSQY
jgi:hypothetical protein